VAHQITLEFRYKADEHTFVDLDPDLVKVKVNDITTMGQKRQLIHRMAHQITVEFLYKADEHTFIDLGQGQGQWHHRMCHKRHLIHSVAHQITLELRYKADEHTFIDLDPYLDQGSREYGTDTEVKEGS
jgi:hypothetical protein